ncbi:MAG: MobF family relaxase [Acidimicrobiales bacterium]
MLRVARVTDATGRYYLADLASARDPGLPRVADRRSGVAAGRWTGAGAAELGLRGRVDAASLGAVLSGQHPSEGDQLRVRETTVRAYDLTFAAPKSASVLFALEAPDAAEAVLDAHEMAVAAATRYVAAHAAAVRRTVAGARPTIGVEGLVAAIFTHHVSRALDPHLHSHVVVASLAHGGDSQWRAIDGRGLFAHAQAAGALYDAVLRHEVTQRLGFGWSPRQPRGWELTAVGPVLVGAFSSRRAEILAELGTYAGRVGGERRGTPSPRARALAWAVTRDPKGTEPPPSELRTRWAAIARDAVGSVALEQGARSRGAPRTEVDEHRFAASIHEAGSRGAARRDAVRAWSLALGTGAPADSIERCVGALCHWGPGTGVGEALHAPAEMVPAPYALQALGPRPASPEGLAVWLSAASSIARYRGRWDVQDRSCPLGCETGAELAAMPARRLADHLSTSRALDEALTALGRRDELARRADRARGLSLDRS